MSDHKSDVFTQLGHAVLDARYNGTTPERAEASRLMLLGKLAPLQPNVEDLFRTEFLEVPMAAISCKGRIAFVGIKADGSKYVVVRDWETGERDVIYDMEPGPIAERIDHLHFPEGSEEPAFVERIHPDKKSGDGLNTNRYVYTVQWGTWRFEVNPDASGKLLGIHCFERDEIEICVATILSGGRTSLALFRRNYMSLLDIAKRIELIGLIEPKLLCVTDEHIVVKESHDGCHCIRQFDFYGGGVWQSDWLNEIVENSVMLRDGQISFVALAPEHAPYKQVLFFTPSSEKKLCTLADPDQIHYLPSGRILMWEYVLGNSFLCDVVTNKLIELVGVKEIGAIVEIPSGLVIQVVKYDGSRGLTIVHEDWDVVPGVLNAFTADGLCHLGCCGDHVVFQTGAHGQLLRAIHLDELERWLVRSDEEIYEGLIHSFPLYTPFERLVHTQEGILSWHFVNGTFIIIRYPLD